MNTQLCIKLTSGKNVVGLVYKPTEFQVGYSGTKDIKTVLKLGSSDTKLHESLSALDRLFSKEFNIYDYLVSKGKSDVNEKLKLKKLTIPKLFNFVPFTKINELTTLLSNVFIKEPDFYDFSIGMLDFVSQNIQKGLDADFVKINRRIDSTWSADVVIETTDGNTYQSKSSSFSFKDNYKFELSTLTETIPITKVISELFITSIRPYIDIFMEKIIPTTFQSYHSFITSSNNIHYQMEQLAWELYNPSGEKRYPEKKDIYSKFNELVLTFEQNQYIQYGRFNYLPRAVTATLSAASSCDDNGSKIDYTKFETYHNRLHQQWIQREKEGIEQLKLLSIDEIEALIHRSKRYSEIVKIGKVAFDNILNKKESYTRFADIVSDIKNSINKYIDAACEIYAQDADISE